MDYSDFYDIAVYGNEAWKGCFSQKEIACNAYDYKIDFDYSKASGKITTSIYELLRLLIEDGSEETLEWADRIKKELNI